MIELNKTITVYIADDGKEFLSHDACVNYEEQVLVTLSRNEYLNVELTKLLNEMNIPAWEGASTENVEFRVTVHPSTTIIEQRFEDGEWEEPDEDFYYNWSQFQEFEKEAMKRYLYEVTTSIYYWGK